MRLTRNLGFPIVVLALSAFSTLGQAQTAATVMNQTYAGSYPATITGTLPNQDTVLEEAFTLSSTSDVTAYTTSYATGGFQPSLILYGPNGVELTSGAPGGPGATGSPALDVYFSDMGLTAGTYTLAVMDYNVSQSLTATSLNDGFTVNYGNGSTFVDVDGTTRTGNYSVDLSVTPSASTGAGTATPEPATAWLVLLPALFVGGLYGRKHFATVK